MSRLNGMASVEPPENVKFARETTKGALNTVRADLKHVLTLIESANYLINTGIDMNHEKLLKQIELTLITADERIQMASGVL